MMRFLPVVHSDPALAGVSGLALGWPLPATRLALLLRIVCPRYAHRRRARRGTGKTCPSGRNEYARSVAENRRPSIFWASPSSAEQAADDNSRSNGKPDATA